MSKTATRPVTTLDPMQFVYDVLARVAGVAVIAFVLSYTFPAFANSVDWLNAPSGFAGYGLWLVGLLTAKDAWAFKGGSLDVRDVNAVVSAVLTSGATLGVYYVLNNWPA